MNFNAPPACLAVALKEATDAMMTPMVQDRVAAGIPLPSMAEKVHLCKTLSGVATAAAVAVLMRTPDWSEAEIAEVYAWIKRWGTPANPGGFGKS